MFIGTHKHAYWNSVVNAVTLTLSGKPQKSQNYCIKFVYNLRLDDHITSYGRFEIDKTLSLLNKLLESDLPKNFIRNVELLLQQSSRDTRSAHLS